MSDIHREIIHRRKWQSHDIDGHDDSSFPQWATYNLIVTQSGWGVKPRFGKNGEFAEKYFKQGTKIAITGRIQTGSYTNRDGQKIYTTDVVIEEQEFAESKKAAGEQEQNAGYTDAGDGFMNIPDGVDEQLPFA